MKVLETNLEGCLLIEPRIFNDNRGHFLETYNYTRYMELAGLNINFVQDNQSLSKKGILRGLHFQKSNPQGKLVSVAYGEVFDVAVDMRPKSKTFGEYFSVILDSEKKKQLYVPPGFAHGFYVLSDMAIFNYKCTDYYNPNDEGGIIWNDPCLNINWPNECPEISEKDKLLPKFSNLKEIY
ncbi:MULTISPECIES: dTDP-4-dehydrorhamnose 3,5-epimerase [Vibrio]|uniref:dTDP-4-dehydrorhamnose 3,5-epimerase n=1 Tax=Vibrio TaxID=662 RepID=UPI0020763189|nr:MULTISPECIES: dTDP-4-dehydrorhamnose 3,5-epimerase [Vibrio]USD32701.1 dTDP-4-dehydrorhamnose 3,5-epimerase [Vibrio sp. SCSIO 43186]USD45741.1 dTDP-4-dehydrorhamnose 3,5-epimerase [Vibrio sp. SCSIO 43145]USD69826.1 dTDP-4-dehydrorhamnose 3,5-epimerase [Vibrio sp. SCSIO 43139]USD94732.1 dTDP-4-dehydrorhamnose 3,5-epimerase [Vibrio coralliilyticus]